MSRKREKTTHVKLLKATFASWLLMTAYKQRQTPIAAPVLRRECKPPTAHLRMDLTLQEPTSVQICGSRCKLLRTKHQEYRKELYKGGEQD